MSLRDYTPQQIEEILQAFFDVAGTRQYIGARYVPIFGRGAGTSVDWDEGADAYEPLSIVYWRGDTYTSRRYVPAGIDIQNTDYWVITGRYNAQVEQYRQEVLSFQGQIDAVYDAMDSLRGEVSEDYVPFPHGTLVDKYGTEGQVLSTLADGNTEWVDPVVVTSEIAEPLIEGWLDDHPEATTTVEDGAVTTAKIADGAVTNPKLDQSQHGVLAEVGGILDGLFQQEMVNSEQYNVIQHGGYISSNGADLPSSAGTYPYRMKANDNGYVVDTPMLVEFDDTYYCWFFMYNDSISTTNFLGLNNPNTDADNDNIIQIEPSKFLLVPKTDGHTLVVRIMFARRDNAAITEPDIATLQASFSVRRNRADYCVYPANFSVSNTSTFSSIDDFPPNTLIQVLSSAITAGLANVPYMVFGGFYVWTAGTFNDDKQFQILIPFRNDYYYSNFWFRVKVSNNWRQWQQLQAQYDLYPTGDTTNVGTVIRNMLNQKGVCRLAPGDYYINNVTMPANTQLIGAGRLTRIIKTGDSPTYMIQMGNKCVVKDLAVYGSLTDITPANSYESGADPKGIHILGTGSGDVSGWGCLIENVYVRNIAGAGIRIEKTGYDVMGGCLVSNAIVENCNCGILLGQYGEFHRITNCAFRSNYCGSFNGGGNNSFANCDFSANTIGLLMDNSGDNYGNSSHGMFNGCTFNHSGNNEGTAIKLDHMIAGEMFVGCMIFYGAIEIDYSQGIVFDSCDFGSSTPISIDNGNLVMFVNSVFRASQSPVTITDNTDTKFVNCWTLGGSVFPE